MTVRVNSSAGDWGYLSGMTTGQKPCEFKSKHQAKSLLSGMAPCSSRDVVQTGDKYLYRKERKGPCGTVVQKVKSALGMVSQWKEAIWTYLELVRLHQKYHAQFCAPKYEAGAEVPMKGH